MKRIFLAVAVSALLLMGCKDPYGASAKAAADIAGGISTGISTTASLGQQDIISLSEEVNVLGYLEFANQADEAFVACIQAAHTGGSKAGTFTACAQTFNTTLNNPAKLALVHVANAQASQTVTTIINGLTTGVAALQTALGGA